MQNMKERKKNAGRISVDRDRCKGCGLCVHVCSRGCLAMSPAMNVSGYNPVDFVNKEHCTACGMCYQICPEVCIDVFRGER